MMKKIEWTYLSPKDQQEISVTEIALKSAKAVVVIVHGMVEHQDRYDEFRKTLYESKFASVAYDVRGHGRSLFDKTLKGHFADKDAWACVIDDLHGIIEQTKAKTKQPIILFGHSLGSVMVRSYLNHYSNDELMGVLLSGSPSYSPAIPIAIQLLKVFNRFSNIQSPSPFLTDALFVPYQKAIKNRESNWDWLSYSKQNIKAYRDDEFCGFPFTLGALEAMFTGFKDVYHDQHPNQNNPLPIHFMSGIDDPCHLPKGLEPAVMRMQALGYAKVSMAYVEEARHEFLNEDNRKESMQRIINVFESWLT